jgi:AFG3 family protein
MQELLRLVPTILLIAGYVWFTRRQMGGLGGQGPGGRGLFNVGKAQVRSTPEKCSAHALITPSCQKSAL